jgi:uncharacterized membrane protein YozB (DUF420 family)
MEFHDLPVLNASLNGLSAIWLIMGFIFIRLGHVSVHRFCMLVAMSASVLFLISYLLYHFKTGTTTFQSHGWIRPVYFTVLVSHTILAVVNLPLVITTLTLALKGNFTRHRKFARFTWPIWIYVSTTGVLIYFMLYHIDPRLSGGG